MRLLFNNNKTLIIGALALLILPFAVPAIGLTISTATVIVTLAIAVLGLNMMMGYTGLVSFGHGAWFGIGGYVAAIVQRNWLDDQIIIPILLAMVFVGVLATIVGALMLRRSGVYFALMTLALTALTYTVSFRWTSMTGGEDGLGNLQRGQLAGFDLDNAWAYYVFVALIGFGVLVLLLRVTRSPFGHVLVAIRENQTRAMFQGFSIQRYKLGVFVLSASITALAGALSGFQHYLVTAEATSVEFSGELMAMVVIGGMRNILGPAIGVVFYIIFREMFSIYTDNWLFWFGLIFVAFVMYSPGGLAGIWTLIRDRLNPPPEVGAAMSNRKIYKGLPLPKFLRPQKIEGTVMTLSAVSKNFGGIKAVEHIDLNINSGEIHALIGPNGAGKTTLFNLVSGMFAPDKGSIRLLDRDIQGLSADAICQQGLARSFQITNLFEGLSIHENLRLSAQAKHPGRYNFWRDANSYTAVLDETRALIKFLGLEGIEKIKAGDLSYGGQRLVDLGIALASKPQVLLMDEPLAGLAAAERERVSNLVKTISKNVPVLIVEHDIDRVLALSDQVTVMNEGTVLMSGTPDDVRKDARVQQVYTGTGTPTVTGRSTGQNNGQSNGSETVLHISGINTFYGKSHILNDTALTVHRGEIVALLGRNGAGKSTLLKTISGLVPAKSGSIQFNGQDLVGMNAPDIARLGIGYVPQGRGIFAGMTVGENLSLGRLARSTQSDTGIIWSEEKILATYPILQERYDTDADYLSGGEQQMLAVARALSGNVRLLLLDEPFEGLAPAVVQELFTIFDQLRRDIPIIIVEHNLDLVLALADRVYALERGAVFHEGKAEVLLTDIEYRKEILWL